MVRGRNRGTVGDNLHVSVGPWRVGGRHARVDQSVVSVVQGRDVDIEDLFEMVRKVRLFEDDATGSINREIQRVYGERVSLKWMLAKDLRELSDHPFVWFAEPILQSL